MKPLEQIAKQILGEEIRQLTELERMANVPRLFEFMCRIVDASRSESTTQPQASNGQTHNAKRAQDVVNEEHASSAPNGLTEETLRCCERLNRGFTIADVVAEMQADNFVFVAKSPSIAVADVVRRYTGKKLEVAVKGRGSKPGKFNFVSEKGEHYALKTK